MVVGALVIIFALGTWTVLGKKAASNSKSLAQAKQAYETGHFAQAEKQLAAIVVSSPDNTEALNTLALAQAAQGENPQAVVTYQKIVRLNPKDDIAWYRMAMINQVLGHPKDTADELKKALAVKPLEPTYTDALARTYMTTGDYAGAAKLWGGLLGDTSLKTPRKVELLVLQSQAYEAARDYGNAKKVLAEALKLDPGNAGVKARLAAFINK